MNNLQKQFEIFHGKIKMEKKELREKRDIILDKIVGFLKTSMLPIPELLNQGSYIYGVGIKPISDEQEFDIDVGLVFDIKSSDYSAKCVRGCVYDAVKNHTHNVEEKGSCIRVRYEAGYHVDLVCYASNESQKSENFRLARQDDSWESSDPKRLEEYIQDNRKNFNNSKDNSGSDQLQRVVRYLKRWNDKAILEECDDKPTGLALCLLCIKYLKNPVSDDLKALIKVVDTVKDLCRISVDKPSPQYEDVFGKISDDGMCKLMKRFSELSESLQKAMSEESLLEACRILRKQFGDDFPLPNSNSDLNESRYRKTATPAIITSSSSA